MGRLPVTKARAIAAACVLAGCAQLPPPAPAVHHYVLLGPGGAAVARVITAASQCPQIDVDGTVQPMSVRMPAATISPRSARGGYAWSQPAAFPVLTCEAWLPAGASRAAIDGHALPLPKAQPQRIVVLGDTGCRLNGFVFQDCNDRAQWPFARVADAAALTRPDLVIHVGDYHYRESACPLFKPGCARSPWGYGWDAWRADLFHPARHLFEAAPWVVARGNHETCTRAGQGWWRFLDPRPVLPGHDCNVPADDATGDYSEPYALPLGDGLQLLVFDSSRVGIAPLAPTDVMYRNYHAQFERAFAMTASGRGAFFLSHHPVLGFAANPSTPQRPYPGNAGLQSVLDRLYPTTLFPPNVQVLLAGHSHALELLDFSSPHPPQVVTGNGGVWVDLPFPTPFPAAAQPAPGAVVAGITASNRFGFLTMERHGAEWTVRASDVEGVAMSECTLRQRQLRCTPIADAWVQP